MTAGVAAIVKCYTFNLAHISLVLEQFPDETVLMTPLGRELWVPLRIKERDGKQALSTCLHDIAVPSVSKLHFNFFAR